ncbi:MAG: hypothetical protein ACK41O_18340, partial [Runella zeae]
MFKDTLSGLNQIGIVWQEQNASGLRALRLLPVEWVTHFFDPLITAPVSVYAQLKTGDIVLKQGLLPIDIEIDPNYSSLNEDKSDDPAGSRYRASVSFTIPKDRPALAYWLRTCGDVRFLALMEDRNGFFRVAGTKEQPLRLSWSASPGNGRTGRGNRTFNLSVESTAMVYFSEGISNDFLIGTGPYSV